MRTITIEKTIARYEELTEAQKIKVIDNLRGINIDHDQWHEYTLDDAEKLLNHLGFKDVKIAFSGFSSQGDGASFTGKFKVPQTASELNARIKAFKDDAPLDDLYNFSDMLFTEEEREEFSLDITRISNHYSHSNTVTSDNDDLTRFVRLFSDGLYRRLEKEHDYLTSREAIEETIEANEYEFDIETLKITG